MFRRLADGSIQIVCDGCGRIRDKDKPDSKEWWYFAPGSHKCPTCSKEIKDRLMKELMR